MFSTKKQRAIQGFTLLELLVVVAIIGFLSSVSIVALTASQQKSRDTQRKLDQLMIIKAADLYTNDFGAPPAQLTPLSLNKNQTLLSEAGVDDISGLFSIPTAFAQRRQEGGGGGGGCTPSCGNNICEVSCVPAETAQSCIQDCHCGNNICEATYNETASSCAADCTCNNNLLCETSRGENIGNCPNDCTGGSSAPSGTCGNNACNAGETPGNCSADCPNLSMCYISGEWNLCCLFGGTYCTSGQGVTGTAGGFYGVCLGSQCQQKYFLEKPAFTCALDAECVPPAASNQDKFVPDSAQNWVRGLERYMVKVPKDPAHHKNPAYDKYYCSSHPDIVGKHQFCCWASLERETENFNPYNDVTETPTGYLDPLWTLLCTQ